MEAFWLFLGDVWGLFYQFMDRYTPDITLHDYYVVSWTVIAILLLNVIYYAFPSLNMRKRVNKNMTRAERRAHVRRAIADAIVDAVEDKVHAKEITRNEADGQYFRIAYRAGYFDLLPVPLPKPNPPAPADLKREIVGRFFMFYHKDLPKKFDKYLPKDAPARNGKLAFKRV